MADASAQKPGLTTFGWLAIGATAAAVLASPSRREKLMSSARDTFGKWMPNGQGTAAKEA